MMRRRLIFGVASMAYGKFVSAAIQLAMVPALASAWGVALFGQWLMLATIPAFLAASDFGMGTAAGNRMIGEVARSEESEALTTFQSGFWSILICTGTIGTAVIAAVMMIPDHLLGLNEGMTGSEAREVLVVLILFGLLALQGSLFMAVMRAQGAFARSTTWEATIQLAEGAAVISVALSGREPIHAAFAYLTVRGVGVTGHVLLARRHARWLSVGLAHFRMDRARELLRPALAAMMLPLSTAGLLQGTALAVGAAAGAAAVPVFTSLRTLSRVVLQVLMTINLPILPEFTGQFARGNREWIARATAGIASFNAFAGLVGAVALGLLGEWLLEWWTGGRIVAPLAMIWLTAAAIAANTLWNPMSNLLLAVNRHLGFANIYVGASCLTVALTYVAVVQFGVTGAAATILLMDLFMLVIVTRLIRKNIGEIEFGWQALTTLLPARWR